jgi:beta-galactosidase/beta-glucuronidase
MMRKEYPRPQFVREQWQNLNGTWRFAYDDHNVGKKQRWYLSEKNFTKEIQVPFVYQTELSGINDRTIHECVWYQKEFELASLEENQRVLLHFGAVDYEAEVYINQQFVGRHEGGHTSFSFDITEALTAQGQIVTVRVWDPHEDETIPRGKQFWETESRGIWYTNSTGIWQTVWLEIVDQTFIESVTFTPDLDRGIVDFSMNISDLVDNLFLHYKISYKGLLLLDETMKVMNKTSRVGLDVYQNRIFRSNFHDKGWTWSPEEPNLFDVELTLSKNDQIIDQVTSYFGMRKIHTESGMTFLNNQPYYQKLVLDQGYWEKGLLTAPADEDYKKDILLAKEMGFNGCRKHQKTSDPRFLYWADVLGFIVWGECASAPIYTEKAAERLTKEWLEIISRDYNHPSIITWVPLNESWGVPEIHHDQQQQHFSEGLYHLLHALDKTRLVISNDGWEMTVSDICAIHNYNHGSKEETKKYEWYKETLATKQNLLMYPAGKWAIYAKGYQHQGEPILLTEFGGIGYRISEQKGWGYTSVESSEEFIEEYRRIMAAVYASKGLWGFCYTQLTDVEQEINGLLGYDRKPKCNLSEIKKINDQFFPERI